MAERKIFYQPVLFSQGVVFGSSVGAITYADNILFNLGTDADIAMVNRATVLNANTALTGVIVGTPVTPAVAANSLLVGNITADGDMMFATQTGGNSYAFQWYDASAKIHRLYAGSGVEAIKMDNGTNTVTGSLLRTGAGRWNPWGAGEAVTIASGVATVTKPYVILDAEGAGTTDQLDSISGPGTPADGDMLMLVSTATDTITVDDANINLGAATRAIAPGGTLVLRYDGTESQWTEVSFLTAADNT